MKVALASLGVQTSPLLAQAGCPPITGPDCPAGQVNATDPNTGCPTQTCVGEAGNVPYVATSTPQNVTDYMPYVVVGIMIAAFVFLEKRHQG